MLYIFIGSRLFWKRVDLEADLSRNRRVSILDCEGFRFMSNAKYFYYMDLIRFEILFRSDLYKATIKKGMFPVLGSQKIIYKKPLKRWQKFKITLVLEGWEDHWAYHRQIFTRNGEVYAIGITKVGFWKNRETQDMRTILAESGITMKDKIAPAEITNLFNKDYDILKKA
ncbi:acyl-CoA thioesterase [Hyunsoonleella sp. SJ7]|uniref:Acyl-CoA thioesterase n=1 Tax=Hyunsoonleella aquatilis TaxID=2762758 RepID=A0A923HC01_9FLAO|nr:acyl-CoA thioesterase [Hyunsoonleella aquatilis]MBC3759072.1 acyl-CoA thioesterase [Hyunsoonleella aquatilis]